MTQAGDALNGAARTHILLVEDNPDHAEFAHRALRHGVDHEIIWVKDGEEALDFLHRQGRWASYDGAPPVVILLDIGLPKIAGHEVLRRVKSHDRLRHIPVIMLSTSGAADDVARSYDLGANSYVVKTVDFTGLKAIRDYWLNVNVCPEPAFAQA
jgi:CheY-like chemotaxis protein